MDILRNFLINLLVGISTITFIIVVIFGIISLFEAFGVWVIIVPIGIIICSLIGWLIRMVFEEGISIEDEDDEYYDW